MSGSRFNFKVLIIAMVLMSIAAIGAFAAVTNPTDVLHQQEQQQEFDKLNEKITKPRTSSSLEIPTLPQGPASNSTAKVFIKTITVLGATVLSQIEIRRIVKHYENQELTLAEMTSIVRQINLLYKKKGYITSFAYLPPQRLKEHKLIIKTFEGKVGIITITGNHHFSTKFLLKTCPLKHGQILNYNPLKYYVEVLNRNHDRHVHATLSSGTEPGTTDITFYVKDRKTIHFRYDFDNYGTDYIGRNEYHTTIWDTNLLGMDDTATYGYQTNADRRLIEWNVGYNLPVGNRNAINISVQKSYTNLGSILEPLAIQGKSKIYTASWITTLVQNQTWTAHANLGFDYKDVFNFIAGSELSRDRLREVAYGGDIDHFDSLGRTYFNASILTGIPDFLGGLQAKDPTASVLGSGGEFTKATLDLIRLQRLPFDTVLTWRNETQQSSATLPSTERFQIGGITNDPGYLPGEVVGDEGYSSSWDLAIPLYPVPRNWKVPFTNTTIYNGVKFVPFYDWAEAVLLEPPQGEKKHDTLRSAGPGLQMNISDSVSCKIEYAWALGTEPSDQKKSRLLLSFSVSF